jgi:hypothetical protein
VKVNQSVINMVANVLVILYCLFVQWITKHMSVIRKVLRVKTSGVPRNFPGGGCGGGLRQEYFFGVVQQIQLRIEVRENGDLGR